MTPTCHTLSGNNRLDRVYGTHAALSKLNRSKLNKQTNSTKNPLLNFDSGKKIRSKPLQWKTSQLQERKEEPLDTKIHHCVKRRWSPSITISTIQTLLPPLSFLCVKSIDLLGKPYWRVLLADLGQNTSSSSYLSALHPPALFRCCLLFTIQQLWNHIRARWFYAESSGGFSRRL